jgi:ribosomal protein S18 acetylase RimI-like enzyme
MPTIRPMTIADYDGVYDLWISTPGMGLNATDDSREGIAQYLRRNPATCFVAEEAGRIVGVIMAGHDGRRGFIYHTAVRPECRKQGIATLLLQAGIQEAKLLQRPVILACAPDNLSAMQLYQSLGFSHQGNLFIFGHHYLRMLAQ